MSDDNRIQNPESSLLRPRWGNKNRIAKAGAIWATVTHFCGSRIGDGLWLDIGCGNGEIAATLAPHVKHIIGIDPEPWSEWRGFQDRCGNLELIVGSYESPSSPIKPSSIDFIICNQVYEHVADPLSLIGFIYESLKPGGCCYFAGPNLLFPIEPHVFWPFVHWLPREWAVRLMRILGSRQILDANSRNYWTLMNWFKMFSVRNAVPYVIRHPRVYNKSSLAWRMLSWMPESLCDALTPISPSFIFVLYKQN